MLEQVKTFLELSDADLKDEVILKRKGAVFYLVLNRKGNAFNKEFLRGINRKLDIVTQCPDAISLVSVSTGKLFSGGLDLSFVSSLEPEDSSFFVLEVIRLFGRLLAFNCPTLCLVKGAAYAGGCMLAFSHDQIHVFENATFCCNEVQLGLPLPPGMNAVVQRKMCILKDCRDMVLYAKKFSAQQGIKSGFVDSIIKQNPMTAIHQIAESRASFSQNRSNFKKLKEEMNKTAIDCCLNRQHAGGVRGEVNQNENRFSKL